MKNLPHRWMTMVKKNTSTLHRWQRVDEQPDRRHVPPGRAEDGQDDPGEDHHDSAAMVRTPKT